MKITAIASATIAALLAGALPAFAGNIYLLTVPLNVTGLKAGTQIDVSCAPQSMESKGADPNARAATLDANPPKDASKVTVVVGAGPADAVVPLVAANTKAASGISTPPTSYECWSSYGGYVSGSLSAASTNKVTPTDSWDVKSTIKS
jgi:hypothetical protein